MQAHRQQPNAAEHFFAKGSPPDSKKTCCAVKNQIRYAAQKHQPQGPQTQKAPQGDPQSLGHVGQRGGPHGGLIGGHHLLAFLLRSAEAPVP